ncbi:HEPN domain-containing protein [Rhizobium ruizarguesonis]|uniref:HEPN domain-containing protein n=1 Tax=Rhizobium ruizarguesonis TaxID=2081791 RepID=UPI0010319AA1|nr:HEPN domain-containing protein [Rhizobium ruizarguesonis]TBE09012.1 hypothetical protein ELH12_24690 [Rhizobium ruizarguesonis]TBE80169.1 hypothetical protein ELH01_24495 [Rhizobium ruizarguesonis]TBE89827.1 hypothetical protein ELG99_24685 [Rhizobium ruizarguesonis]
MQLDRTAAILEVIETSGGESGPTQSFLAQYLAIIFYSEMEEKVAAVVKSHLEKYTHVAVATFVSSSLADLLKRLPKSDIAKLALRFGEDFKEKFNSIVDERQVSLYMNVIQARHQIGHSTGANITLSELKDGCQAANSILRILSKCLDEIDAPDDVIQTVPQDAQAQSAQGIVGN